MRAEAIDADHYRVDGLGFYYAMKQTTFDYSDRNKRWQRVRELALRRDGYKCQEARRYGLQREANTVHHCWPVEDYPEYAYELWNLVSLSASAHNSCHNKFTNELTEIGKRWKRTRTPPRSR